MEKELRFDLDLGRLALLKKTFESLFFKFLWAKKIEIKKIVASVLKSCIK